MIVWRLAGIFGVANLVLIGAAGAHPLGDINDRPARAVVVQAEAGFGGQVAPTVNHDRELSHSKGGLAFGGTLRLRSRYFLSPFFRFSYVPVYANEQQEPPQQEIRKNRSTALTLAFGPSLDIWRLRLGAGLSFSNLRVSSSFAGTTLRTHPWYQGYEATVCATVFHRQKIDLGAAASLLSITEADLVLLTVQLTASFDAFVF
jgi:hypothetical protein